MAKKTHVIKDESLGGIEREYIEVERKADVGDKVIVLSDGTERFSAGEVVEPFEVNEEYGIFVEHERGTNINHRGACLLHSEYKTLEPTDIVHVDGIRYRMVDRKAEVGERVIIVTDGSGWYEGRTGEVFEVIDGERYGFTCGDLLDEVYVDHDENDGVSICVILDVEYHVLVPVESESKTPQNYEDVIARLVSKVSGLEAELTTYKALERVRQQRLEYELNGMKRDIETWSRDVEGLRYANEEVSSRLGHVEKDAEEIDEKIEMIIDDIVTLDERTNAKLIGGVR